MDDAAKQELRRLAVWIDRRRAVDDAVRELTAHGPAAGDLVFAHLDALSDLLAAEADAFATIREHAPVVPQRTLNQRVDLEPVAASVHSLQDARRRRDRV